jgi:chromosome segregation ATPase
MTITKERIFQIADDLDANGQNPTLALVRKNLGGGSYTTISEVMTEWRARKAAKESPVSREPLPQAAAEHLLGLGTELWAMALDLANTRLSGEYEALEATRLDLDARKNEAVELANAVTAELDELQTKFAEVETAKLTAQSEAESLRVTVATLTERLTTAEARVIEIEKRADDLNSELARVNGQNAEMLKTFTTLIAEQQAKTEPA